MHNRLANNLVVFGILQGQKRAMKDGAPAMLAQVRVNLADDTQVMAARHLTLVRSSLWDQAEPVAADWADANPEKAMAYLMVTQSEALLG
jgi:hypothetical protein